MGMYGLMQTDDEYWQPLTIKDIKGIHTMGGSVLGTSKIDFDAE